MKLCRGCKQKKELIHFWKSDGEIFTRCSECRSLPRVCSKCKGIKGHSEFHFSKNSSGNYGYQSWCKYCQLFINRKEFKNRGRGYRLKNKYGITLEDYNSLLEAQDSICAICKTSPEDHLYVDHDTGVIRGLLCLKCNSGLGMFKDKLELIESAAHYLRESRTTS